MWEIVRGLMTSLLASQWPLVAGAILCVAAGWLLKDIVGKRRKSKKIENAGSRMEKYVTKNGNEDSENKAVADPNKENGIAEILNQTAKDIERNKGNVFELKEIWVDAIEPIVNISMELRTRIQESGIICSALIEVIGISKEGREWSLYIGDDDIGDREMLDKKLKLHEISNEIVQISIEIRLLMTFAKIEDKESLIIKGIFHKPGERITGEWIDDRFIVPIHGETKQSPRRGYDREGVYDMLEEQMKKAIEGWKNANC